MECPCCHGAGCEECGKRGTVRIEECPLEFVGPEALEVIQTIMLQIETRAWPIAGGMLDQAEAYLQALEIVTGERKNWRAQLGMKD